MTPKANDIYLTTINEGSTYQNRLSIARMERNAMNGAATRVVCGDWLRVARETARSLERQFDDKFTCADILSAAAELSSYYAEHLKECEG